MLLMTLIKPVKIRLLLNVVAVNLFILCSPLVILLLFTKNQHYTDSLEIGIPMLIIISLSIGLTRIKSNLDDIEIHNDQITGPGPFKLNPKQRTKVTLTFEQLKNQPMTDAYGLLILGKKSNEHIRIIKFLYEPSELIQLINKV